MKFTNVQLAALVASVASAQTLNIPTTSGDITSLPEPSVITGNVDLENQEFDRGHACDSDADTGSDNAVFILEDGASLSNVIIGANSLEGVHCQGKSSPPGNLMNTNPPQALARSPTSGSVMSARTPSRSLVQVMPQ